jgi:2-polyprenyl-3-methyl-5-hydroxy-6-metoxy-1,4-benzoquinol methylase
MNEWKIFFNGYAPNYDNEVFTKNTDWEVEFLIEELDLSKGASILDIGCGTGRHSIGLALKGYRVTGVDISSEMLKIAKEKMKTSGVIVSFICVNALDYVSDVQHDAAICLCEGAFCLLGSGDDPLERDLAVLRNINRSLKPGAKLIINVLNGCRSLRAITDQDVVEGRYDLLSMVEVSDMEFMTVKGIQSVKVRERVYTPPEFKRILNAAGFQVDHIFGGTAGSWNRETPRLDEMELMAIARKSKNILLTK